MPSTESSSTLPRVKPISGSALSDIHCSDRATTFSRVSTSSCAQLDHSALTPSLPARLRAVRMFWNFLPLSSRLSAYSSDSSAT